MEKKKIEKNSGIIHQEEVHWEMDVGKSVFPRGYGDDPAGAFLARPGKDRARPHVKINECDH